MKKNILLLYGGEEEASISCISSKFIYESIKESQNLEIIPVIINSQFELFLNDRFQLKFTESKKVEVKNRSLFIDSKKIPIHYCIPCIHGAPGENGQIQEILNFYGIKYLGNTPEISKNCFNKITTKLWAEKLGIPTTPFEVITKNNTSNQLKNIYTALGENVFIKTSSQGSSIGCYPAKTMGQFKDAVKSALEYGPFVLIEKAIQAREIEIAAFQFKGKLMISNPGEVLNDQSFYSYEDKYSEKSSTKTTIQPKLDNLQMTKLKSYAERLFKNMSLKDLARIDFFLKENSGEIYLNEINTFPGMTPISLFPKLLAAEKITMKNYLLDRIEQI